MHQIFFRLRDFESRTKSFPIKLRSIPMPHRSSRKRTKNNLTYFIEMVLGFSTLLLYTIQKNFANLIYGCKGDSSSLWVALVFYILPSFYRFGWDSLILKPLCTFSERLLQTWTHWNESTSKRIAHCLCLTIRSWSPDMKVNIDVTGQTSEGKR